jgi:hypothetical protein
MKRRIVFSQKTDKKRNPRGQQLQFSIVPEAVVMEINRLAAN